MAKMSAWPFGKEVVHVRDLGQKGLSVMTGTIRFVFSLIWAVTFGIGLFFACLVAGVINCLTLIGIPLGLQSFKRAALSLWPVGRRVVPVEAAQIVRAGKAAALVEKYRAA
ncbi:YccF domain-containing protein [Paenirhodobacter sp.]|uniref:YccF domain-containing protein n=1 Tax=Paenirhodobacter sp. TaxID=1965326 RepID=UPI003B5109D8